MSCNGSQISALAESLSDHMLCAYLLNLFSRDEGVSAAAQKT